MIEYLTIDEVSKLLRVHRRTIQNYIKRGTIPAIKLSTKTVRIPRKELLERLINASMNESQ